MNQTTIRRPRSDGRCIHCGTTLTEATKDHVFPGSWYPDTTPSSVQRWTAPSCRDCNEKFGRFERELLEFFAVCIDPRKPAARGLYSRVRRSLGIGVGGLDDDEKVVRDALRGKLLKKAERYSPEWDMHTLPGLGPHPEAPLHLQRMTTIEEEKVQAVVKKVVRGCEYWLANARLVEPPYDIEVIFAREPTEFVTKVMARFAVVTRDLEPGLRIRRSVAHEDPRSSLYELTLWDTTTVYATILPPESEVQRRTPTHEEISTHAYYHWEERGRPEGSPEVDWHWAVEDLNPR